MLNVLNLKSKVSHLFFGSIQPQHTVKFDDSNCSVKTWTGLRIIFKIFENDVIGSHYVLGITDQNIVENVATVAFGAFIIGVNV
jgi:hypothetical protein